MAEDGEAAPDNLLAFVPAEVTTANRTRHHKPSNYKNTSSNAESPLDMQLEKLRIVEALLARDHAVYRMENICASLRQKESTIAQLEAEKTQLQAELLAYTSTKERKKPIHAEEMDRLQRANKGLQVELNTLRTKLADVTARIETENMAKHGFEDGVDCPVDILSPISRQCVAKGTEDSEKPEQVIQARYAILAELPLPPNMSSDMLLPVIIPPPFTIHDFIMTVSGPYKAQLTNYRVFQESTTSWCPEREEHGYYLTPFYKCNTNPRVTTAHRWAPVDLTARFNKSTECFYNKDGKWYYAGVYKSFRLRDITPQEWVQLPTETTQALVKETLAGRKNTSPQNVYETGQLYAVGALKAACIGLQCIGFDEKLYRALLAQAEVCAKTGKWRGPTTGLGTGAIWNVSANTGLGQIVDNECESNSKT